MSTGRDSTGASRFQSSSSSSHGVGRYSRAEPMFFSRGINANPSMWANANPTNDAPWVSV